jgi:hypothetical protein
MAYYEITGGGAVDSPKGKGKVTESGNGYSAYV